jgi:hypothetical protein
MSMGKHSQTQEGEQYVTAFSKGIPEMAEKSPGYPPAYISSTSSLNSPSPGMRASQENPDPPSPVEPPAPFPLPQLEQATYSNVGVGTQDTFGSSIESPSTSQVEANAPPAVTASTALSLRCRMCNVSPTVATRPTVTTCGHLFCSEYVSIILCNATARLTLYQVHHTIRDVDFQMPCLRQRPLTVLFIQT